MMMLMWTKMMMMMLMMMMLTLAQSPPSPPQRGGGQGAAGSPGGGGGGALKETDVEAFRERLFAKVGEARSYNTGDKLITEGQVRRSPAARVRSSRHCSPIGFTSSAPPLDADHTCARLPLTWCFRWLFRWLFRWHIFAAKHICAGRVQNYLKSDVAN